MERACQDQKYCPRRINGCASSIRCRVRLVVSTRRRHNRGYRYKSFLTMQSVMMRMRVHVLARARGRSGRKSIIRSSLLACFNRRKWFSNQPPLCSFPDTCFSLRQDGKALRNVEDAPSLIKGPGHYAFCHPLPPTPPPFHLQSLSCPFQLA